MKFIKRGIYPNKKYLTLIHATNNQIIVGTLYPVKNKQANIEWNELYNEFKKDFIEDSNSTDKLISRSALSARAGGVNSNLHLQENKKYVKNVPSNVDAETVFEYQGKIIFDIDYANGSNEYDDHSIIEFFGDGIGKPLYWKSRFVETLNTKIKNSLRFMSENLRMNEIAYIGIPFKKDSLLEVGCLGVNHGIYEPISNIKLEQMPLMSGGETLTEMYKVYSENLSVGIDNTITVPFNVKWIHSGTDFDVEKGSNINNKINLTLSTDKGYLPKTKISTDNNGSGEFKISALGLDAGDVINVKFGVGSFTNIGKINITVI
jgi:hypothetical protein